MSVLLNHTIVSCRDKGASAQYLVDVLGLDDPVSFGPFMVVEMANGVSMDYDDRHAKDREITPQHYAFLVSEDEFDSIFGRIEANGQDYWSDPGLVGVREINHNHGGRGVYFKDPNGHLLEILTSPYGSR